jgi:hypothetical protein
MPGLRIVLPSMVSQTYVHERSVSFGLSNYCFPYSADVVLQDVCSVVGTANPLHNRVWMRNIFTEEKGQAIQQCLDPMAPLVTRATDCRAVNGSIIYATSSTRQFSPLHLLILTFVFHKLHS